MAILDVIGDFFTYSQSLMSIADVSGQLIEVNKRWEETLGSFHDSELKPSFLDLIHPDDLQEAQNGISELRQRLKEEHRFVSRYLEPNQRNLWLRWSIIRRGDYLLIEAIDFTAEKLLEDELAKANSFQSFLVDSVPTPLIVKDYSNIECGVIKLWNEAAVKYTGISKQVALGKSEFDFMSEEAATEFLQDDQEAIKAGKAVKVQNDTYGPHIFSTTKVPFVVEESGKQYLLVAAVDVTNETELATEVFNQRETISIQTERLQEVVDNSPGMVYQFHLTDEGVITFPFVSPQSFTILGYTPEEVKADPDTIMGGIPEEDIPELFQAIDLSRETMNIFEWTGRIRRKDQSYQWVKATSVPKREEKGATIWTGIFIPFRDEAERLIRANKQAEAANETKSYFLANVSHELRTPMHGVLSFAEIGMERYQTGSREELLDFFKEIYQTGSRLLNLVNDLLDYSKLDAGQMTYHMEDSSLDPIIQSAVAEITPLSNEREIQIKTTVNSQSLISLDSQRIHQVLSNLLSNAVKFSHPQTTIRVKVNEPSSGQIKVDIANTGIGIDPSDLEAIFDIFSQGKHTKFKAGGTGLGLSICKRIVEFHGGKIWAESQGNEVVMSFVLPTTGEASSLEAS